MKPIITYIALSFLLLLSACNAQKTAGEDKIVLKTTPFKNGKETLYLLKNKTLDTATVNGSFTYQVKDNAATDVVQYTYEKDMDKVAVDGGLREELLFEIPKGNFDLSLANTDLQKTKMLFGRYCYCRGQNGIFTITDGHLTVTRQNDELVVTLDFHQKHIPQAFEKISSK